MAEEQVTLKETDDADKGLVAHEPLQDGVELDR